MKKTYVWCSYRAWSFRILEAVLGHEHWQAGLVVTTEACSYPFKDIEKRGTPVLRIDPKQDLKPGGLAYQRIADLAPEVIFHYGWSWLVPPEMLKICPNVTLHPGKLPRDRGGSPIQNLIRNGDSWTYANLLKLEAALDAGPVYRRERISLHGDSADDVWARMVATGTKMTCEFFDSLSRGEAVATPQSNSVTPTQFMRVTAEQAEIRVGSLQTAQEIYDIVRAHSESDPDSYVRPAFLRLKKHRLIVERASLEKPATEMNEVVLRTPIDLERRDWLELCAGVNNQTIALVLADEKGRNVRLTRIFLALDK